MIRKILFVAVVFLALVSVCAAQAHARGVRRTTVAASSRTVVRTSSTATVAAPVAVRSATVQTTNTRSSVAFPSALFGGCANGRCLNAR